MDLRFGQKLRSILTNDNQAIAKSINEIGVLRSKIICGSHRRGEHGGIAPTGDMIKIIARTFHLSFKTKIGRGDAPVLAPLSQISNYFYMRR
jgi:hypothetical protein